MASKPERLRDYIRSISPPFKKYIPDRNYGHMGATLADAVLQSNNNYERNVRHRIAEIRKAEARFPDLNRLLLRLTPGTPDAPAATKLSVAQKFLRWNDPRRAQTFLDLVNLLDGKGVNTEDEFREWLLQNGNCEELREIRFIGPKTVSYLKLLVGLPVAAVDIRLRRFLKLAGFGKLSDECAQDVIHRTADLMKWDRAHLDHSIWRYMAGRGQNACDA